MIVLTEIMLITLILLIVLQQRISARLKSQKDLFLLTVSSTLFSFEIDIGKKHKKKKRRGRFFNSRDYLALVKRLIPRTEVEVNSFQAFNPHLIANPTRLISFSIFSPILLAYLKNRCESYRREKQRGNGIDIIFTASLLDVIISFVEVLYYKLRKKLAEE